MAQRIKALPFVPLPVVDLPIAHPRFPVQTKKARAGPVSVGDLAGNRRQRSPSFALPFEAVFNNDHRVGLAAPIHAPASPRVSAAQHDAGRGRRPVPWSSPDRRDAVWWPRQGRHRPAPESSRRHQARADRAPPAAADGRGKAAAIRHAIRRRSYPREPEALAATASSRPASPGAPSARVGLSIVWISVTDMAYPSAGASR